MTATAAHASPSTSAIRRTLARTVVTADAAGFDGLPDVTARLLPVAC